MKKFALLALITLQAALTTAFADGVLITHPSGPDAISKDDAKGFLLGTKTKWESGTNVKLAVLTGGSTHEAIIQEYTARSADQFDKYWKKQVFTGKGVAPEAMKSDTEMLAFVSGTAGAFGYVSTVPAGAAVKIVTVK